MYYDQGVLQAVPIPAAMGYLLLRPLLADVPDDDMCGVAVSKVFPASERWHSELLVALSGIPDIRAGDSVCVALRHDPRGCPRRAPARAGNVMYILVAPWCPAPPA